MAIRVKPLHPLFAAEILGLDAGLPVDQDSFPEVEALLDRYAVLVIRGTPLTEDQQVAFARMFGPLEAPIGRVWKNRKHRLRAEFADVSNLDDQNKIRAPGDSWRLMQRANQLWHTDSSFKRVPGKCSLLCAYEIPPVGGETEFADLRAAYDALDENTKEKIDDLIAEHSIVHSRKLVGYTDFSPDELAALPPVPQALVRVLPGSGRKALYLASHASHIVGWPTEQGRKLLDNLIAFATRAVFVYRHRWQVGDLLVWDNRCTMHRGLPYDDVRHRRDLRRITTQDTPQRVEQERREAAATR